MMANLIMRATFLGQRVNTAWADENACEYDRFQAKLERLYNEHKLTAQDYNELAMLALYDFEPKDEDEVLTVDELAQCIVAQDMGIKRETEFLQEEWTRDRRGYQHYGSFLFAVHEAINRILDVDKVSKPDTGWTEQNVYECWDGKNPETFDWDKYQYLCDIFDDE